VGKKVEIVTTPPDDLRSYHITSQKIKNELGLSIILAKGALNFLSSGGGWGYVFQREHFIDSLKKPIHRSQQAATLVMLNWLLNKKASIIHTTTVLTPIDGNGPGSEFKVYTITNLAIALTSAISLTNILILTYNSEQLAIPPSTETKKLSSTLLTGLTFSFSR